MKAWFPKGLARTLSHYGPPLCARCDGLDATPKLATGSAFGRNREAFPVPGGVARVIHHYNASLPDSGGFPREMKTLD